MGVAPTEWHEGEYQVHKLLHVPYQNNPTKPGLSAFSQYYLLPSSLLAIGIEDNEGQLWTTLLGGESGFIKSMGQSLISVTALANHKHDPVIQILLQEGLDQAGRRGSKDRRDFSALGIHLATRDRVKLLGKVLAATTVDYRNQGREGESAVAPLQLVFAITGSLGNCPKYLNKKDIITTLPKPVLLSESLPLTPAALDLISKADLFFLTSYYPSHMSTNHRGGPAGLIRVSKNDSSGTTLIYPEYSGNRMYQTLGNLHLDPRIGIAIPDFTNGNILLLSGTSKIIIGPDAASMLPRSNLAVEIHVQSTRLIENGLSFRGIPGEPSPYNPPVRYLSTEHPTQGTNLHPTAAAASAKLLSRHLLTPTIARFRFSITDPVAASVTASKQQRWTAGQYVALAFEDILSEGYRHMNDANPRSLNDDFVRTFTVSSPPPGALGAPPHDEFEITIRNVGVATDWLFRSRASAGVEVPLRGFGGTFAIAQQQQQQQQHEDGRAVPFVAGGIGITPLLAQASQLDLKRLRLFWSVNARDLGLVEDTFGKYPGLAARTVGFVSGVNGEADPAVDDALKRIEGKGAKVARRRIRQEDIDEESLSDTWYFCVGPALKKLLLGWLGNKTSVYEDFDY